MFENLKEKLGKVLKNISGKGRLTEKNVEEAVKQVKLSLLEADVNYKVVKEFISRVKEKALGAEVLQSFTPEQQFIAILRDELVRILGEKKEDLKLVHRPSYVMFVGLQGSGKTTTAAKLAVFLKKSGRRPLLVAADLRRPAAVEQLIHLGNRVNVPVVVGDRKDLFKIVAEAKETAESRNHDVVILDTAGRLHIDDALMEELAKLKELLEPDEILMVVDAMVGQDAVNSARRFDEILDLTGFIVTKLDGDARGGVILSIRYITGKPVKFVGVGEKLDALEPFYPDRIASRILGMGDVLSLIDKIQQQMDAEKMKKMEEKFLKVKFDLEDFLEQLREFRKLGSMAEILEMIPGMPKVDLARSEEELKKTEAIICSMTKEERRNPRIIDYSRKRRIARGSGTTIQDVNRVLKSYETLKVMMKRLKKGRGLFKKFGIPF
ncbi:MAG: signal recognition particle protein [Thermotogae bacterium]|nr:signal recognition particle protein [Thermotogota bacterium]